MSFCDKLHLPVILKKSHCFTCLFCEWPFAIWSLHMHIFKLIILPSLIHIHKMSWGEKTTGSKPEWEWPPVGPYRTDFCERD